MKAIALITIAYFLTFPSLALTLDCRWLESTGHSPGFYQKANIVMNINEEETVFEEDTFLFRNYTPCWTGGWETCAFGFTYYGDVWQNIEDSPEILKMTAPGAYWSAQLEWIFRDSPEELEIEEVTKATLNGDDGDGVWFSNEEFICRRLN